MSDATDNKLEQVYELIRQENLDEAAAVLQPVLLSEPENADAWWLWANTVTEPEDARQALQKVMQYNPAHQAAQQMLEQLSELYPPVPEAETADFGLGEAADFDDMSGDTDFQPALDPDIPAMLPPDTAIEAEDDDILEIVEELDDGQELAPIRQLNFAAEETASAESSGAVDLGSIFDENDEDMLLADEEDKKQRRPILRTLLFVLLILVAGIAVVLLLNQFGGDPVTQVAQQPQPPEAVQAVISDLETTTSEQADVLGGPATIEYEMIDSESAVILQVCRSAGPDISNALDAAMEIMANESATLPDEVALIGVRLINCDRADVLLGAYTAAEQFQAYQNAAISAAEFRDTWQWEM